MESTPYPPDPIKPGVAAKLLGVSVSAVYRYMKAGQVRWWRLPSGHRMVSRAEVLGTPVSGGKADGGAGAVASMRARTERTLREFGL